MKIKILRIYRFIKLIITSKKCKIRSIPLGNITTGEYVYIAKKCIIDGDFHIGDGTFINDYTRIENTKVIGKCCSISHNVKIGMGPHPLDRFSTSPLFYSKSRGLVSEDTFNDGLAKVQIGNDVLISANAIILKGVKLGDGCVVGAGAVVTKEVPPYAIVVGVPAKVVKYRFDKEEVQDKIKKWNNFKDLNDLKTV